MGDGVSTLVSCPVDRNEGDLRHEDFEERVGHGPLLLDVAPDALELLLLLILLPRVEVHGAAVDERCGWKHAQMTSTLGGGAEGVLKKQT